MLRFCHACQQELDATSLAAARCGSCGAVIRSLSQRTIDDKNLTRKPAGGDPPEEGSIDIELKRSGPNDMTMEISPSDTKRDISPKDLGKASDPERKSPTVAGRADMTIDYQSLGEDGPRQADDRATHAFDKDMTLDLGSLPAEEVERLQSQWRGTFVPEGKQGQTIRQRETVSGFRSSLPVKSRFVRERRKDGGPKPSSPADVPDYELLEIIGEGGMGVVYAAHQSSIARTVAVKMLKPSARIGEEQRDKFISEAVVTGELDHPNIVPIYDLGANDAGALFYSMKRVKGTPWDKVVGTKSLDDNLSILLRVADAVAFAHAHGVVHRDLKPENVMLGDYGEVLVMDWGLARITTTFANADAIFQADSLGGTPAYMAPEMARGPVENINFLSDIYLLGAMLYEIIGGKPPHSGRDVMQCLMNAAQNQIDGVRYEGELKSIALKAMATRQEDRYPSVKDFQEAIKVYQSHSESLVLTAHANLNLQKARESGDYQLYARALYGFQESLNLWDANHRARTLLAETQRDYAQAALDKGDLDLAASNLDPKNPEHVALLSQINAARAERDARNRRLRRAKQAVAGLIAAVVTIITLALFFVNQQRSHAVVARQEAEEQRGIAQQEEQKATASAKEAKFQQGVAEEQTQKAVAAESEAVTQAKIAKEQEAKAREQEQIAVGEKEAKEYEEYVAKIGLAAAKINDNAFDYALELLNECSPKLRNWEWGRLVHLCRLGAGSYTAAGPVDAVAYSPDGKQIASGDWGGQLSIRDAATGKELYRAKHGQYIHALAYSPDGHWLATGSSDHKIRILNVTDSGLKLADPVVKTLTDHTDGVLSVQFSPDTRQLLSGSYDGTARLFDLNSDQTLQIFRGHNGWVWRAVFSPDGGRILTTGQDGKAIVWQKVGSRESGVGSRGSNLQRQAALPTGEPYEKFTEFDGHDGAVYAAAFAPDGKLVATGGYDKMVMIWNPDEVQPVDIAKRLDNEPDAKFNYLRLSGHDGPVRVVTFSPNGKLVASGSDDNAIRLWDVASGEAVKVLRGHGSSVRAIAFSPKDGNFVLSGGQDERVRLWNLAGYQEVRVLHATVFAGHADAVLSARFSPDGREVVTASRDRTAALWDVASGKRLRQFEEGHEFLATSGVFFADGKRLATGAGDNSVRIWDAALGTQLAVLEPTGRLGTLAVSPDGDWLATGSPGHEAKVWDAHSGQPMATLSGHNAEVSAVAFSPQGDILATGDDRGQIRLWKRGGPGEWTLLRELRGHSRSITDMRFTPDGKQLVSASGDRTCGVWDVATGEEATQLALKHPDYVSSLDVSPDGTLALTTCDDGVARLWRLADGKEIQSVKSPGAAFNSINFAPDGKSAVVTSSADRAVRVWSLSGGEAAAAAGLDTFLDFKKLGGVVWSAAFARDGKHILTIGGNDAELWSMDTHRPVVRYSPHGAVASAALSPNGKLLVTGSWDHSAKIWNAETGQAVRKLDGGHVGYVNSAEFSPDGAEVLTASDDGTARLWEVQTGKLSDVAFLGHTGRVLAATFSPDGNSVLTVSADKSARIWDRRTGQLRIPFTKHAWGVLCGEYSPDGKRVITGSEDKKAKIWDASTGEEIVSLEGHTAAITSVAFSPDGSRALTGSQDNTVKLWDARTGKEILSLAGHEQPVTSVAFSPDGKLALSSSRDGTAIVWLAVDWRDDSALKTALAQ